NAPSGDGGVATDAVLKQPWGLAVAADGTVIIGTAHGRTMRSVAPSGIITTIAGTNATTNATLTANGSLASGTSLSAPWDVKIAADGSLVFIDYNLNVVRRAASVFPPMRSGAALIPSSDGSEVYVFKNGRHVRTVDAMTSVVLYQLAYDANGLLTSITDVDGNATTILRDSSGNAAATVAPGGQRTQRDVTANGLVAVTNPAGESNRFSYDATGLMVTRHDPRGNLARYTYNAKGRLMRDEDAADGVIGL